MRRPRRMTRRRTPDAGPADHPGRRAPLLPPDELPRHVAIIMDGNRRWARQRDLPELDGHAAGVEAIRDAPPSRGPARRPGHDPVRLQPRELGALGRGGRGPVRPARGGHPRARPRSSGRRASGSGCSAARRAARRHAPVDRRGARRDRRRRPAAAQHRLQLRRPDRARRRVPAARRQRHRRPTRSTRGRSARPCTPPACPTPTSSSGPVASSACRTS